ncbi:membrane-binding protein [Leptospira barantonii]|uniref:Membrane-binding protein n=1 Tax=Leptospira barantonii TaxID=2023184 RepID=A0ABX4NN89_9LEPT|nr:membrane-binding protein [Leptospira barantonii]PJZ56433.1 membrane-binding protein [Leptospira barantonii]
MFKIKIFILICFIVFSILSQAQSVRGCLSGNCRNGKGIFIDSFGNEFKGIFKNEKLEGYAEVKFKNHGTFSGVYKNSSIKGKGQWTDPETGNVVYGTWVEDGDCNENGCKTWARFIPDSDDVECIFRGNFRENRKVGKGGYTCINGESFEGIYSNDLANGYGKLKYSDGTVFEGEFKNGRPVSN